MKQLNRASWVYCGAFLLMALGLRLGFWQLDRAYQKIQMAQALHAQEDAQPLTTLQIADLDTPSARNVNLHAPVRLSGTWLGQHTVYLDNRPMQSRVGFYVYTPLQLENSSRSILIQRGWIARNFEQRELLETVLTPPGLVHINARIALTPGKVFELGKNAIGPIRQNLTIEELARETSLKLLPFLVIQTDAASDGLLRNWPAPNLGVDKHYGYAFQWFSLVFLILGLTLWFSWLRPYFKARAANEETKK